MSDYKRSQKALTGVTPSDAAARAACDRNGGASYYRGGGSGSGK